LLLRAYTLTVAARVVTRLSPRALDRFLLVSGRLGRETIDDESVDKIRAAVDHVQLSGWPLVRKGCLSRGLALFWLLRRGGLDVSLAFGVGSPAGETAAHCWIVHRGEPYLETTDPRATLAEVWRIGHGPHT
jgi:Transglutaminase-like superfamily